MNENLIQEESYAFALRMVRLYKYLCGQEREFVLSKQAFIACPYIGSHIKSAQEAESGPVFIREMSVALQRASET